MAQWACIRCSGMDVVTSILFTRSDVASDGTLFKTSAAYVPGADQERPREEWTQQLIDAIAALLAAGLDAALAAMIAKHDAELSRS